MLLSVLPKYGMHLHAVQISSSVHHSCPAALLLLQVQLHVPNTRDVHMRTWIHDRDFQEIFK
jgi:hypothetical protein